MPGAEQAIQAAARSGWEAVLLVVLVLAVFAFFGVVLRRILDDARHREDRLATRVTTLETEIRTELFSQLRTGADAMARVIAASDRMCSAADRMITCLERFDTTLRARPCLLALDTDQVRDAIEAALHHAREGASA